MEEASASHKLAEHAFHSARALLSPAPPSPPPPRAPSAPPPGVREAAQLALQWLRRHSAHSAAAESCAQWEDGARPPASPRTALDDDWRLPTGFIRALSLTIAPHADGEARPRLAPPAASPPAEARALRRTASFGARGAPSTPPPRAARTPRTAERGGTHTPPRGGARRSAARGEEEGGRGEGGEEGGRGGGGGGASLREVLQLIELGLDGQIEEMARELSDVNEQIASRAAVRLSPPKPSPRCCSPHSSGHPQRGFASEWSTPFASEHASPSASDEEEIEESTPPASPRIASLRPASRVSTGSDSGFATPKRREARVSRGYMSVFLLQKVEKLQRELEAALDGEKSAIADKRELQAKLQQAEHSSRQSTSRAQACASKLAGVEATNASLQQRLAALTAAAAVSHSDAERRKGETAPPPAVGDGGGQKDGVSRGPLAVAAESLQRRDLAVGASAASASPSPADSDAEEGWLGERRRTGLHDSIRAGLQQLQTLIDTSQRGSGLRPAEGGGESSTPLPTEDKARIAQMQREIAILELRNASMAVSLQRCRELYTRRACHLRASRWLVRLFCAWASYATARKMSTDLVASRDESATLWSNFAEAQKSLASARQVIAKKDVQLSQLTHVLADATAQLDHVSSGM